MSGGPGLGGARMRAAVAPSLPPAETVIGCGVERTSGDPAGEIWSATPAWRLPGLGNLRSGDRGKDRRRPGVTLVTHLTSACPLALDPGERLLVKRGWCIRSCMGVGGLSRNRRSSIGGFWSSLRHQSSNHPTTVLDPTGAGPRFDPRWPKIRAAGRPAALPHLIASPWLPGCSAAA